MFQGKMSISIKRIIPIILLAFTVTGCINKNAENNEPQPEITKQDLIGKWEHVKRQTTRRILDKEDLLRKSGQMIWRFEQDTIFVFSYPNSLEYIFGEYSIVNNTLHYRDNKNKVSSSLSLNNDTLELKYTNDKNEWYIDYFVRAAVDEEQLLYLKQFEADWRLFKGEWIFQSVERFPTNYADNCDIAKISELPKSIIINYPDDSNEY